MDQRYFGQDEWLPSWKVKTLWGKKNEDLCDYILKQGLAVYDVDKRRIDINEYRWVEKVHYHNWMQRYHTYTTEEQVGLISKENLLEQLRETVYFHFDDIMNFALEHGLSEPGKDMSHSAGSADIITPETSSQTPFKEVKQEFTPESYIKERRKQGIDSRIIAYELRLKKFTYLEISRLLNLTKDVNISVDAEKKKGERACKRGEKLVKAQDM